MSNNRKQTAYKLLQQLSEGQSTNDLSPREAVILAEFGYLDVTQDRVIVTPKAVKALTRQSNRSRRQKVNTGLAVFLGSHMKPGVGYSVKPQGKSTATSILPHVAQYGIERDDVLSALRALRDVGALETNAGHVKNNCAIRWYLAGTFEPDTGVPQNAEPKKDGMEVFVFNLNDYVDDDTGVADAE